MIYDLDAYLLIYIIFYVIVVVIIIIIIIRGVGCARDGIPGVYARVSYYYDWIVETICANFPFHAPEYLRCTSGTVNQQEIDFFLSLRTPPPITKKPTTYPPSPKPSPVPTTKLNQLDMLSALSNFAGPAK